MEKAIRDYLYSFTAKKLGLPLNPRGKPRNVFLEFQARRFSPINQDQEGVYIVGYVTLSLRLWIDFPDLPDLIPLFASLLEKQVHTIKDVPVRIILKETTSEHTPEHYLELIDLEVVYPLYRVEETGEPPQEIYFNYAPEIGVEYEQEYERLTDE